MTSDKYGLSRRKILGGLGAIGVASAGAGLATSAYFSDQESFEENTLTAGELDLKVDWEEHYNFPQLYGFDDPAAGLDVRQSEPEDANAYIGVPDPDDPMVWIHEDDLGEFMANTAIEAFPDPDGDGSQEIRGNSFSNGESFDPCLDGADLPTDLEPDGETGIGRTDNGDTYGDDGYKPLISLDDVKPGDFGELTLSFHLCDNPGYVWLYATDVGGVNTDLAEKIQTVWWVDDGDNVLERKNCEEALYLEDHQLGEDSVSTIYKIELDDENGDAIATEVAKVSEFRAAHIAASNDGETVYIVEQDGPRIATYDVDDDQVNGPEEVNGNWSNVTQATVDTDGTLWLGDVDDDELLKIPDPDASNPEVTETVQLDIDIEGGDNAFTSNGQFFLFTKAGNALYTVDLLSGTTTAVATFEEEIDGLAVRDEGTGEFVGSQSQSDTVYTFDEDGNVSGEFTLTGALETHTFGDMTNGSVCERVLRRGTLGDDLTEVLGDGGFQLDDRGIKCFQPGFTRYVGFAWWLPRDVGNEVQTDSVSFNLGFYTEQCRHNDDPTGPPTEEA